ncbi:MAG: hypothetical protein PHI73_00310 [Patescibacteria group bacterium]|nr:hypothetical protein [Patescibacteria group bacterium]
MDKPKLFGNEDVCAFFPDGRFGRFRSFVDSRLRQATLVSVLCTSEQNPLGECFPGFQLIQVPFGKAWVHLALRGFTVFEESRHARSAGSGAVYLAQSEDGTLGWLLQLIRPWVRTSWHYHTGKTEQFYNLAGACARGQEEEDRVDDTTGCSFVMLPEQWHFLQTTGSPALNLLAITNHNGGDPLSMDDYVYRDFSRPYPPTT